MAKSPRVPARVLCIRSLNRETLGRKKDNNFIALRKVIERIIIDSNAAFKLKEVFSKSVLHDSPLLQIILIDDTTTPKILEFLYSPNQVLEGNW